MKTYILLVAIFVLSLTSLQAQVPEFDLSKYARPTISRRSLDLVFNFDGQQNTNFQTPRSEINNLIQIGGDANLHYQFFRNSPKYQHTTQVSLGINPTRQRRVENTTNYSRNSFGSGFSINTDLLRYNEQKFFIGTDLYFRFSPGFQRIREQTNDIDVQEDFDSRSAHYNTNLSVKFLVGRGRVELVEDARQGLFILQALEKDQNLARDLTETDIIEFADQIAQLKNQRFFDSRLQRIRELEQIHAFLREKGIVRNEDIAYFAMVQDLWSFGSPSYRRSGNRFSIGINPNIQLTNQKSTDYQLSTLPLPDTLDIIDQNKYNFTEPTLYISFLHVKPLSEAWQESFGVTTNIGLQRQSYLQSRIENGTETTNDSSAWNNTPSSYISAGYSLSYYPNTRTSFQGYINSTFSSRSILGFGGLNPPYSSRITYGNLRIGANAYYYLSPQTRLSFNYSAQITSNSNQNPFSSSSREAFVNDFKDNTRFSQGLNVSLSFAWF